MHGWPGKRDHGPVALQVLTTALPVGDLLVVLVGYAPDLQRVIASDMGFKGRFLLQLDLPYLTPFELARIVPRISDIEGLCWGGLTTRCVFGAIAFMGGKWRASRNGMGGWWRT